MIKGSAGLTGIIVGGLFFVFAGPKVLPGVSASPLLPIVALIACAALVAFAWKPEDR